MSPQDLGISYLLNRAYLQAKQYQQALTAFRELERLDPDSVWVRVLRGQAYDGLSQYSNAIEEFETARRLAAG